MISLPSLAGQTSSIAALARPATWLRSRSRADYEHRHAVTLRPRMNGVFIPGCVLPCNAGAYNGTFTITAISGTTVQYTNPVAGLAAASGG